MSWHIRIAGPLSNKEGIKARIRAERTPPAVEAELLKRIDSATADYAHNPHKDKLVLTIFSTGHVGTEGPYAGGDTLIFQVYVTPFIDTPVEVHNDVQPTKDVAVDMNGPDCDGRRADDMSIKN